MKTMDYGTSITGTSLLDWAMKPKNWIITRFQFGILRFFGILPTFFGIDRMFSRLARKLVGGYLYSIKLEINSDCRLACKMCYVKERSAELPATAIINVLNQLRGYGVRLEILGGEPLLRSDIVEIVEYAKHRTRVPFISLYTNGLPATPELSFRLKKAGLDAAIVTLISDEESSHDKFTMVESSWKQTIAGIRSVLKAGVTVYTFAALHSVNAQRAEHIHRFVKDKLGARPLFYQYVPQQKNDPLTIDKELWHSLKHRVLCEWNPIHGAFVKKFFMLTGNSCSGGNFVLTIKADGSVQPCPFVHDVPLGNILTHGIWTIYKNRYHGTGLTAFKSLPEECCSYSYKSVCGGGCRAGNAVLFGDYHRRDAQCLGPFSEPIDQDWVLDRVPTFF